jgi:hypothetical protein
VTRVARLVSRCLLLIAFLAVVGSPPAGAHERRPVITTLMLGADAGKLEMQLDIEAALTGLAVAETAEATAAYKVLRALEPDQLRREFERVSAAFLSSFAVTFDRVGAPLRLRALDIPVPGDAALPRISTLHIDTSIPPGAASVRWLAPPTAGDSVIRIIAMPGGRVLFAGLLQQGESSPDVAIGVAKIQGFDFTHYVVLGFEHIVPEGLDHILFVVGLFLLNARLKPLLWQVSAFTLAHSVTLALGIYGILRIPPEIIEPMIAASIVFVAVENLTTDRLHRWRPGVIFAFGLVHGLGFAGVLAEIGLPKKDFLSALIGFNIGVELGQLSVLAGCFLAVGLWFRDRAWYRIAITNPASLAIAVIAAYWFVERMA